MNEKHALLAIFILAPVLLAAAFSIDFVQAGYRGVTTHFGAVDVNEAPRVEGLNFKVPFQDKIIQMSVKTQKYPGVIEPDAGDIAQRGIRIASTSNDLQDVYTEIVLNLHINGDAVNRLYKNVGLDYKTILVQPLMKQSVKEVMAEFKAEELVRQRQTVKVNIEEDLRERLYNAAQCQGCIILESVSITDIDFTEEFSNAIESKVTAVQKAEQALNDLERIRVEAMQAVAVAEGQAESINIVEQALSNSPNYIEWLATNSWNGKLPLVTGDGATPFINIPSPGN